MNSFQKSIELALADFELDYENRVQVFSFAWLRNRLVGMAKNDNRTHPLNLINGFKFRNQSKGSCAELRLFLKIKNRTNIPFNKLDIINVRLTRNLEVRMSHPCPSCVNLIKYLRPKSLYYSNDLGKFERYC